MGYVLFISLSTYAFSRSRSEGLWDLEIPGLPLNTVALV